jgi:predicted enzyme related to lactoylglutathione lyase
MSNFNSQNNRAVWFDIPVADLDRAAKFYRAVLSIGIDKQAFGDVQFCVLEHRDGNGGCLVLNKAEIAAGGVLLYLNVNGRIREAVNKVVPNGGTVVQDTHPIGPHGFRAIVLDSEGNRIALHSETDA